VTGLLLVSYVILWIVVIALIVVVLTMARLIGLLYRRFPPYGARGAADGAPIGSKVPAYRGTTIDGRLVEVPDPQVSRPGILIFVSPSCGACAELAPAIRSIWRSDRKDVSILLVATAGDAEGAREFAREHDLTGIPYVVAPDWAQANNIMGTPYAVAIDADTVVRAKGVANHLEHLDSLLAHLIDGDHSTRVESAAV
jgi:methylamine dehydrogenase accessory protein MauD